MMPGGMNVTGGGGGGGGGGGSGDFTFNETPSGTINGANTAFTISDTPSPTSSLLLFLNGVLQKPGGADYSLSGTTITFVTAPETGSVLLATYTTA